MRNPYRHHGDQPFAGTQAIIDVIPFKKPRHFAYFARFLESTFPIAIPPARSPPSSGLNEI